MSEIDTKLSQLVIARRDLYSFIEQMNQMKGDYRSRLDQQEAEFRSQLQVLTFGEQDRASKTKSLEDSILKDLIKGLDKLKRIPILNKDQTDETVACFEQAIRKRDIAFAYNLLNALRDGVYLGNFITLPETVHGDTKHPSSYVEKYRLSYDPRVSVVNKLLGLNLENTAEEQTSKRPYIGSMRWDTALKLNLALNGKTPSPRRYHDLRLLLKDGIDGKIIVYDGLVREVGKEELTKIRDEEEATKDSYRGEFLDAMFTKENCKLHINSDHKFIDLELVPSYKLELQPGVMEDCYVDAFSFNEQGLPTKKSNIQEYRQGENIYHSSPRAGYVAGFFADSDRVGFFCGYLRELSNPSFGVRHEREKFVL